eukprot:TRINITY_DN3159_c0_g1_i1.p1 TRINITY_DN3159_c0_g1~~TRINITY_DN3159_c0_g1_i1.p1  ORF type:complete len:552 (+),score=76.16 TRINITY_DN3159_c0_g1_i1:185-1657(+)
MIGRVPRPGGVTLVARPSTTTPVAPKHLEDKQETTLERKRRSSFSDADQAVVVNAKDFLPRRRSSSLPDVNIDRMKHSAQSLALLQDSQEKQKELAKIPAKPETTIVPVNMWFHHITGCDESYFALNKEKFFRPMIDGNLCLVNSITGKRYGVGKLSLISIYDLYSTVTNVPPVQKRRKIPPIELITCLDKESIRFVDVAHLQAMPENRNAVFQIASNFNGVEGATESFSPGSPNYCTNYHGDRTQGPAASISCGAGAIYRVFAPFYGPTVDPSEWHQTKDVQMNFLSSLKDHFPTENGYVIYSGNEPKFPKKRGKKWYRLLGQYNVCLHRDQQVTLGHRTAAGYEIVTDPNQRVDQVCCAAVNMIQGASGCKNNQLDKKQDKMKFILQAAYDGTYLAALANHRKKIYLTLIGGGAFGNHVDKIFAEILAAHKRWANHPASEIEKVVLVMFHPLPSAPTWLEELRANNIPCSYYQYEKGSPNLVTKYDAL